MEKILIPTCLAILLVSASSCFKNFYDTRTVDAISKKEVLTMTDPNKTVIVHFEDISMRATNIAFKDSVFTADLRQNQSFAVPMFTPDFEEGTHVFKIKHKDQLEAQVHVFVPGLSHPESKKMSVPMREPMHVQTYAYNKKKSTVNQVFSTVGLLLAVAGTIGILAGAYVALIDGLFAL